LACMSQVTQLLTAIDAGDPKAASELLPLVYDELRQLAVHRMAGERPDHTLDATALVHEAYLRLADGRSFASRGHFFAAAAEAMRRILVDRARIHAAKKRGGHRQRVPLTDLATIQNTPDGMLALDEALCLLEQEDPKKAELVKLRFFGGLNMPEIVLALGISLATAERWWSYSRAWLFAELSDPE
jgi:RNA polymerase sigma factor (TIGR02999 family)